MNWKRGVFRFWVVASGLWIVGAFWWRERCLVPPILGGGGRWCDDPIIDRVAENLKSGALIIGVPAGALLVGLALIWIANGFRVIR
jgi:hypothetical protein